MAINKNFVVKNGFEVNSNLIFADATLNRVGIGSTIPKSKLDVSGGIGATSLNISGVGTIVNFRSTTGIVTNLSATNLYVGVGTFGFLDGTTISYDEAIFTTGTVTYLNGTSLNFSGIGTINGVKISSGIITSTNPGVTTVKFYGDGSGLSNIPPGQPVGANGEVQYNNNGVFGASPNLRFDGNNLFVSGIAATFTSLVVGAAVTINASGIRALTGIITAAGAVIGSGVTINSSGIRAAGIITATSAVIVGTSATINSSGINVVGIITATSAVIGSGVTINSSGIRAAGIITATSAVIGSGVTINSSGIRAAGIITATSAVIVGTSATINSSGINVVGIITATSAVIGSGVTINSSGIRAAGIITATSAVIGSAIIGSGVTINSSGINMVGVITATDFDALSDINYKQNVNTVNGALLKVEQLRGVKFDWKESGLPSYGVIAQELQEVLPELVHGSNPKTVNYNGIIGVLIEAIKELKKEVDDLKN